MTTFDVGIIGAGVHGSSVAYHLSTRGVRVVVVDRAGPASGPTGRSSAICRAYYTNAFLARTAHESIGMFERFEDITGRDAEFHRTGLLYLHPPEDASQVATSVARLNELGVVTELLSPDEVAARFPMFDLEGIGVAAFERDAGYADPHATTEGLFRRALANGVEARLGSPVVAIQTDPVGGGVIVTANGTRTSCGRILIAAGPWTRPLARQVGVDLPLTVERHVVATYLWGSAEPVPGHGDLVGGYYLRTEGEEQFLMGSVHAARQADPDDFSEEIASEEIESLASALVRRVPGLLQAVSSGGWASLYDVSPDWQPVIGEIAPGIFVDAGTSGHGFKLAPALGKHIADLVTGAPTDPGLADFSPFRFEHGGRLPAGYRDARILG